MLRLTMDNDGTPVYVNARYVVTIRPMTSCTLVVTTKGTYKVVESARIVAEAVDEEMGPS